MSTVTVPAASRRTRCGRHRWRSDLERAVEQILLLDLVRGGGTRRRRGRGGTGHHLEGATDLHGEVHRHEAPRSLRSEEHTSELQSRGHLVCRLLLEKKNT